jgi:cytochrome c-type biogenesis protein CcmH
MIWIAIGLMALAVIAAVLWPMLKTPVIAADRSAYDLTVFQDQLKEVDRDLDRGVLTAEEADAARLEIQRRIIAASKAPMENKTADSRKRRIAIAAVVAVLVPALAVGIYLEIGAPSLTQPEALSADAGDGSQSPSDAEINKMVEQLAAKVADNPTDVEGVTYRQMGRFAEAVVIYKQLAELQPSADVFSSLGEVIIAAADGQVSKEAHDALVKALTLDRSEPRARFYLGLEQAEKGEAKNAIAIWRDLSAEAPPEAPWLVMVREQMADVAQRAGIPPMTIDPKHPLDLVPMEELALARMQAAAPPSAPIPAPAPGPDMSALQGMPPEQVAMIEGMVKGLAERLEKDPSDYKGWMMLGRSYTVLKDYDGARKAYDKAIALQPADVEPRLQLMAAIMTTVNPDLLVPLPKALSEVAADILKLDAAQPDALYVSGLVRAKSGDADGARDFWQKAQSAAPADWPFRSDITKRLQSLP